jgi:hypothetical protein
MRSVTTHKTCALKGRISTSHSLTLFAVSASCLMLFSCAARTNHFKQFSQAGVAYSNAVTVLIDESGSTAIDVDSMVLVKARSSRSVTDRGNDILEHNKLLKERLVLLGDLKRHARLLRSYFEALGALAESDKPSQIGTAAEGVVQALGKLHPSIENAKVGELPVSGFVGSVTKITVAHFRARALEDELKKRGQTIEGELELQQAALRALAQQMRTELQAMIQQQESGEVVIPFAKDAPLPESWSNDRKEILQSQLSLASVDAAADAATKLKVAFVALGEGRFQLVDVPTLVGEINEIVALVESIEGKPQKQ